MSQQTTPGTVQLTVENIGGIDSSQVSVAPGVTVLTGPNATNRTSLLTAISLVLGGSFGSLKAGADHGTVRMELAGKEYSRVLSRENGSVRYGGNPYAERSDIVDLFACLFEGNEARRAVERCEDLRELVMRPVDVEELRGEIRSRRTERDDIDERLAEIKRERDRLPELRQKRADCEDRLETVRDELRRTREDIEAHEADRAAATAARDVVDSHQEAQAELTDVRAEIETEETSLRALRSEREEVTAQLDALDEDVEDELAAIDGEIEQLRDRKHRLGGIITDLTAIVEFNEELLESDGELPDGSGTTRQLDARTESVECWTCGSSVERGDIGSRLDELRGLIDDHRADRNDIDGRIETLRDRQAQLREVTEKRAKLESRRRQIDAEIGRREERIAELNARESSLEGRVADLERDIAESAEVRDSDLLEKYQSVSDLEYERGRIERDLSELTERIERIEGLADERAELTERRDELREELDGLRTRVEDTERAVVAEFNERMADILELLAYDNVERIWIERTVDSQGAVPDSSFELHVVRATDDGAVYEDTVDHLSESEREVTGLIVALAGYLAHEVYETVPLVMLDSLEAIDASRIARLVEYVTETVPYLVVALLPEDAAALDDRHTRIPAEALQ